MFDLSGKVMSSPAPVEALVNQAHACWIPLVRKWFDWENRF